MDVMGALAKLLNTSFVLLRRNKTVNHPVGLKASLEEMNLRTVMSSTMQQLCSRFKGASARNDITFVASVLCVREEIEMKHDGESAVRDIKRLYKRDLFTIFATVSWGLSESLGLGIDSSDYARSGVGCVDEIDK